MRKERISGAEGLRGEWRKEGCGGGGRGEFNLRKMSCGVGEPREWRRE